MKKHYTYGALINGDGLGDEIKARLRAVYLASEVDPIIAQDIVVLRKQRERIEVLENALRDLLDADRGFLGDDNQCVYCEADQRQDQHADHCVITQARKTLGLMERVNK
jgi:hypothetical protein